MERYEFTGSDNQPLVVIDPDYGMLEFKGDSAFIDAQSFCEPVVNKIKEYFGSPQPLTTVTFSLNEFNPDTAKWLLPVFKTIKVYREKGHHINVKWYLDERNEELFKSAVDYSRLVDIPIRILAS